MVSRIVVKVGAAIGSAVVLLGACSSTEVALDKVRDQKTNAGAAGATTDDGGPGGGNSNGGAGGAGTDGGNAIGGSGDLPSKGGSTGSVFPPPNDPPDGNFLPNQTGGVQRSNKRDVLFMVDIG